MTVCPLQNSVESGRRIDDVTCTVKGNRPVNTQYRHLVLEAPEHVLDCKPGQFFQILCPVSADRQPYLRRPMSIYGYYPQKRELHFLYKVAGMGTSAMSTLTPSNC